LPLLDLQGQKWVPLCERADGNCGSVDIRLLPRREGRGSGGCNLATKVKIANLRSPGYEIMAK